MMRGDETFGGGQSFDECQTEAEICLLKRMGRGRGAASAPAFYICLLASFLRDDYIDRALVDEDYALVSGELVQV